MQKCEKSFLCEECESRTVTHNVILILRGARGLEGSNVEDCDHGSSPYYK